MNRRNMKKTRKGLGCRIARSILWGLAFCMAFLAPLPVAADMDYTRVPSDTLVAFVRQNYFSRGRQTEEMIRELYSRAQATGDYHLLAQCVYLDALAEYSQSNGRSKFATRIDSLLLEPQMTRDAGNRLLLNYAKALTELSSGNFMVAFRYALEAHRLAEETQDRKLLAQTAITLGNLGPYIYDYDQSHRYYQYATKLLDTNSLDWHRLQINYSRLLFLEEKYDSAIALLREPIEALQGQGGDEGLLAVAWLNMGSYHAALNRRDSAYACYQKSLSFLGEDGNKNLRVLLYENIGNYFRYRKEYAQARSEYQKARQIALADSNFSSYASIAYELSVLYSEQGMLDSSYYYLNEYNQLVYRVQQPMNMESQKNYVNMVMELSQSRSQLAERSVRLKNKQMVILGVTAVGIIVTVILLWLVAMERRRRSRQTLLLKEIERQELANQLENEKEIRRLQEEKTEQKIRELTSYTLLLSNKNNVLRSVKETALKAKEEKDESGFDKIKRLIDTNLNMDSDYWEQFVGHFVQVAPHFFENLKQYCPHLTPNETKLCAYIRIGLSSKQIAQLLNLSQESVNKNRYRLRKKLNLEKDMDLDELIAGF